MSESEKKVETLGQYLRENPAALSKAAPWFYNPGFPPTDDLGIVLGPQERAEVLDPGSSTQDLGVNSLTALNEYATSLIEDNATHPAAGTTTTPGSNRGDFIPPAVDVEGVGFTGDPETADEKTRKDWSKARANFDTLAGGFTAGPIRTSGEPVSTLGSFFGAGRLAELVSKTGAHEEVSSNHLLKNRVKEIAEKVEEVLDETNRFSPKPDSSPYLLKGDPPGYLGSTFGGDTAAGGNPESEGDVYSRGLWSVQTGNGLGAYDPEAPHMNLGALRAMVSRMMLEASGEYMIDDIIGVDDGPLEQFASILAVVNLVGFNPANIFQVGLADLLEQVRIKNVAIEDNGDNFDNNPGAENLKKAIERLARSNGADNFLEGAGRSGYTIDSLTDFTTDTPTANSSSWAEPFAGTSPIGMFTSCVTGLVLMSIVMTMMDYFTESAERATGLQNAFDPNNPGTLAMGQHRSRADSTDGLLYAYLRMNGLTDIQSAGTFSDAMFTGMTMFYGLPPDFKVKDLTNPLNAVKLLDTGVTMALSPGYYMTMNRILLRDVRSVIGAMADALTDLGGNLALAALTVFGNFEALDAVGIHKAFQALAGSTVFNFLKICVGLGDVGYNAKFAPGIPSTGGTVLTYEKEPKQGVLTGPSRIGLSRFWGPAGLAGQPKSALSLHLQNTLLLSPKRVKGIPSYRPEGDMTEAAAKAKPQSLQGTLVSTVTPDAPGRFSPDTVQAYEVVLDQEYTPFYMHDLRTNELIALPAFISSVSDSFSPEYTETQGYGRTDAVRTYTKTSRTIDLTFVLAAMNETDMYYMWFVINKIVAMCYPQKSVGQVRNYSDGSGRFIQPFSQVPTASPLIRLRLGELFHSNYSVAGLKRLFGVDTPGFNPAVEDPSDHEYWEKQQKDDIPDVRLNVVTQHRLRKAFQNTAKGEANTEVLYWMDKGATIVLNSVPSPPSGGVFGAVVSVVGMLAGDGKSTYPYVTIDTATPCKFKLLEAAPVEARAPVDKSKKKASPHATSDAAPPVKYYKVQLLFDDEDQARKAMRNNPKLESMRTDLKAVGALLVADTAKNLMAEPNGEFDKAKDEVRNSLAEGAGVDAATAKKRIDDVIAANFFGDDNAVVRSFRASAGRGLAGVITNLSMNYDGATWGTDPVTKDRVPKRVEITMGFAPIHDLPLGLDFQGELVAPVYPVGGLNTDPFKADGPPVSKAAASQEAAEKAPDGTPKVIAQVQAENANSG